MYLTNTRTHTIITSIYTGGQYYVSNWNTLHGAKKGLNLHLTESIHSKVPRTHGRAETNPQEALKSQFCLFKISSINEAISVAKVVLHTNIMGLLTIGFP